MNTAARTIGILYNAVLKPLMSAAFFVGGLLNKKFALRAAGVQQSRITLQNLPPKRGKRLWFHAASMGEFEQAKPVIEYIRRTRPDIEILASFFSVSGYENQKNYDGADWKVYIPIDTRREARRFVERVQPDAAVFVRYDIWFNHLNELRGRNIPAYLICATVNQQSWLYRAPFIPFTRAAYDCFTTVFALDQNEADLFNSLHLGQNVVVSGDTRMDRIVAAVEQSRHTPALPADALDSNRIYLALGSSWPVEEQLLAQAVGLLDRNVRQTLGLIIVPHEPTPDHIRTVREQYPQARLYSELNNGETAVHTHDISYPRLTASGDAVPVIIIDTVGLLLRVYAQAALAFVGGGFGAGVHSVTEPAGHALPICCGPDIDRARAAQELQAAGGLEVIESAASLAQWLSEMLLNSEKRARQGEVAEMYVKERTGFSEEIGERVVA